MLYRYTFFIPTQSHCLGTLKKYPHKRASHGLAGASADIPPFKLECPDRAEQVWTGKTAQVQISSYPVPWKRRWVEESDKNVWTVWLPKCHFMWLSFPHTLETSGIGRQWLQRAPYNLNTTQQKGRFQSRQNAKENCPVSRHCLYPYRVGTKTKVPISFSCHPVLPYLSPTMQKCGGNKWNYFLGIPRIPYLPDDCPPKHLIIRLEQWRKIFF